MVSVCIVVSWMGAEKNGGRPKAAVR
jgi:hypothetical protein